MPQTSRAESEGMLLHRNIVHIALLTFVVLLSSLDRVQAQAADAVTGILKHAGVTERLGDTVDLDSQFLDEHGKPVRIGDYFDGEHPVVLTFAYHNCPMLCPLVLQGLTKAMNGARWTLGQEYRSVTVSISPTETPDVALSAKKRYMSMLKDPEASAGWSFLTGNEANIASLTSSAGFEFEKDPETGEYGHAAVVVLLSPKGVVTRYLYGITYSPFDLRAGLVEASEGKVGGVADRLILYCFHYDPAEGSYVAPAWLAMRLAGGVTVLLLAGFLFVFWRRERVNGEDVSKSDEVNQAGSDE
ncbi:MAG: SCO family protein [Rhodothermales bacterium]